CGDAGPCASPQRCAYQASTGNVCVTPAAEGSPCAVNQCQSGLTCTQGICRKRGGANAPCQSSSDCDSTLGLTCIGMTCQPVAHAGPGQACSSPSPRCTAGSDCIYTSASDGGSSSVCVAKAADNAACDDTKGPRCWSPARCRNGVCTVPDYSQSR